MSKDEISFRDADGYSVRQEGASFKEICLRHLSKISELSIREFKRGYMKKKPISTSSGVYMAEEYVEDGRKAYINAVDCFHDLLLPHFDKIMSERNKEISEDLNSKLKIYQEDTRSDADDWVDEKLEIKRRLFQQLSLLLKRLGYLETKGITQ